MFNIKRNHFYLVLCLLLFVACREEVYTPKPRGYYKIEFPERSYSKFKKEGYPYHFEHPTYGRIEKDSMFFDEKTENPWWINVAFEQFSGKIHLSYKEIKGANTLDKMLEDSYNLSHYHTKKADYINEPEFHTKNNVHGVYYEVGGNAASAWQFYATDSSKHFLRGALYFDAIPNADSLKPVTQFLIKDIEHLVNTLKWTR